MREARALDHLPRVASLPAAATDAIEVFAEAQSLPIPAPVLLDVSEALPALTIDIVGRRTSQIDPMYLARLHHATLTGDRNIVTAQGVFLTDLWNQAGLHTHPPALPQPAPDADYIEPSCGLLFHNASSGDNHSHWLLQTLPQLAYYDRAGLRPERLVVQPNIRPYQREVLAALGYHDLLLRHPHQPMRFRELHAGYVDGALVPDPTIYDRQIQAFDHGTPGPEKIYVSRQDARGIRRLLNEPALIERLRAQGFAIVLPGTLSAAEEVTVFRHARLIVGPLGAGLYNALFTRPGATILALSDPNYVMEWLPQTAALRGHAYGWMFGVAFESHEAVYRGTHNNWIVDVDRVMEEVGRL